jgi:hypothetical protein
MLHEYMEIRAMIHDPCCTITICKVSSTVYVMLYKVGSFLPVKCLGKGLELGEGPKVNTRERNPESKIQIQSCKALAVG